MPKQKRWHLKRQLQQAEDAVEKAQGYLSKTAFEFQVHHPEYFDAIKSQVDVLEQVRTAIHQTGDML